ncbi:glycine zipper domain-containing protein [Pseudodesulfovibrio tunisiensis]|uniref:glycine zipper domain-containing protein n=1 Tax=Pseudodesulfovibrio tunisiensis TaxID=463192 RepID=UPI001FB35D3F|nr:glycine zipper domain-containing protein [Pseudodesulfovibrio tunisiensis]
MKKIVAVFVVCSFLAVGFGCATNKAQQGATVGGLAGATIGALTFKDKMLGAAVGAGVGVLMGYIVGNEWDKHDEAQVQQALERNRSNQASAWTNPDTGHSYTATPSHPYMEDHRLYRDIVIKEKGPDGKAVMAKAWRDDNGVWHLKQ